MKSSFLLIFFGGLLLQGCASGTAVKFESVPSEAKIYVKTLNEEAFREVGSTPALIKSSELEQKFQGSGPLEVELRKEGFVTKRVLITELSAADLTISMDLAMESGLEEQENLNKIVDELFEAKRLANLKRYQDALEVLDSLKRKVPRIASIYELEGGIYYLLKKPRRALESYQAAVRYNPKNPESIRMRDMLQKNLGRGAAN